MRQAWKAVIFLVAAFLSFPGLVWSQKPAPRSNPRASQASPTDQPRVSLGATPILAGDYADIPLIFTAPETSKIASVTESISFPKNLVSYVKAVLGLAGEQSQAEITAKTIDGATPDLSNLEMTIASKGPLKPGVLAYLKFKVSSEARKGVIPLKLVASKAANESGSPVQIANGKDGAIGVYNTTEEMPIVGCFFFTH